MGVGRTFSREAIKIFPGGQKWWNFILPIQNHENDLLAKNLQGKCQISNSRGFPPLPTPMLPCTDKPAKTEIWNHVTANCQTLMRTAPCIQHWKQQLLVRKVGCTG